MKSFANHLKSSEFDKEALLNHPFGNEFDEETVETPKQ